MAEVYITSQSLLTTLQEISPGFTTQDLIDLEQFIDADPNDEWELNQGKDYRIAVKGTGLREYTASGAYTIARLLDTRKPSGFWAKVKEMFLHTKAKVRRAFIGTKILDNCSSLVRRSDRYWISRADLIAILGTNSNTLKRMLEESKKTQFPLLPNTDYEELIDNGGIYFSLEGVFKISQVFGQKLTQKNRKEWCEEVGTVIKPKINDIVDQIKDREKNIAKTRGYVKIWKFHPKDLKFSTYLITLQAALAFRGLGIRGFDYSQTQNRGLRGKSAMFSLNLPNLSL
jgi:hypothetical protein